MKAKDEKAGVNCLGCKSTSSTRVQSWKFGEAGKAANVQYKVVKALSNMVEDN